MSTSLMGLGPRTSFAASAPWEQTFKTSYTGQKTWVTVIRRGPNQPSITERHWWDWGNATTDEYVFAFGDTKHARLILEFSRLHGGRVEAQFYANRLGIQPIHYRIRGRQIHIASAEDHPYVVLRTRIGGWIYKGKPNFDVTAWIDGLSDLGPQKIAANGHVNSVYRVGETTPGIPAWETEKILIDPHKTWGYVRFEAEERLPTAPPFRETPSLMPDFPYFDIGNFTKIDWYRANPSPLYWDIPASQLLINPFVGFENAGNYRINSKASPPFVDFESPFAYYNFLPKSRTSQLVIRSESFPATDPFDGLSASRRPRTSFRYSWAGSNPNLWSYSLQLAGSIPLNHKVTIGGTSFDSIGPSSLPSWVVSQKWPMVAFVQAMHGYAGSEGIYEYTPQIPQSWPWLLGDASNPPGYWQHPYLAHSSGAALGNKGQHPGETLAVGFRGEYNASDFRNPVLYTSPVDGLVHLAWARSEVWNLGRGWYVRSKSLELGPYFDAWQLKRLGKFGKNARAEGGRTVQAVYDFGAYVVYSGRSRVVIRHSLKNPSMKVLLPPTNSLTWRSFLKSTALYSSGKSPWNMQSWLSTFPGSTLDLRASNIGHVSYTAHQFRMVLRVGTPIGVEHAVPRLKNLQPGEYLLTYTPSDKVWRVVPAKVGPLVTKMTSGPAMLGQSTSITVKITNHGNIPEAVQAVLHINGHSHKAASTLVASGGTIYESFNWLPTSSRPARLSVTVNGSSTDTAILKIRHLSRWQLFQQSLPRQDTQWVIAASMLLLATLISFAWISITRIDGRHNSSEKKVQP